VTDGHVPDAVFALATKSFGQDELGWVIMSAVAINAFNRMAIAARHPRPGSYSPRGDAP